MSAPLADYNALDRCLTIIARFSGALINLEVILEIAAAVDPIDAGSIAVNTFLEN